MEDTKSLLVMVLQKIFHDRPKVVEDTYQLIYAYNNGKKEKNEYERTLKSICDLMNDELPSEILVYLLTLVDMPHEDGHQLPIMEKIQKTYSCLAESVRPSLLEYLARNQNKKGVEKADIRETENNINEIIKIEDTVEINEPAVLTNESKHHKSDSIENTFIKPVVKRTRNKRKIGRNNTPDLSIKDNYEEVKSLLDLVANYVIKNEKKLKCMYKTKLAEAWNVINSNCYQGSPLTQCYNAVKDINKKAKLLRCIENDNITEDIYSEEYADSDILLKECHMLHVVNKDPFNISDRLMLELRSIIGD